MRWGILKRNPSELEALGLPHVESSSPSPNLEKLRQV
uniref:Uncharacterized protein n=1 Tax=Rhizophora mucronata TaxID=61149 RepID=A0A2P2IU79_RHIMU